MSSLVLKLIAVITMLIDHTAASCFRSWGLMYAPVPFLNGISWYWLCRMIGRIAFPLYCFMIAEGVHHTRNWKKYAGRLLILALVSEFPFDFGLHGLSVNLGKPNVIGQIISGADWRHQNVFFTLFLGMLCVQTAKSTQQLLTRLYVQKRLNGVSYVGACLFRYLLWAGMTFALGWLAKHVLHTDYGMGGVVMISMMGLIYEYWEDAAVWLPSWLIRTAVSGFALWACCVILGSSLEYYGMLALIPIALYNGKKGYSGKPVQIGFYLFYPVHLMALGFLFRLTAG